MTAKRPLFWHQGLFLQPHHFQQLDQYYKSLFIPYKDYITPHFWGLIKCQPNRHALHNQIIELSQIELIFPNGVWVEYPGNAFLQSRSFDHAWVEIDKPFTVYVGLRKMDPTLANTAIVENSDHLDSLSTHFVALKDAEEVKDLYSPGSVATITKMYFSLKIFWETEIESLHDYDLIPVAQLLREGEDIVLSKEFIPPTLSISGSDILFKTVKSIRDQIASRCRQLQEFKSPKEMQVSSFDSEYLMYLLALRSLNRYAPLLFHVLEAKVVSPWTVYGLLRQIVGELSSFSDRINALGETINDIKLLPPYDHKNLTLCFGEASKLITELLNDIIIGPEHVIRLEVIENGLKAEIPAKALDRRNDFYLVLRSKSDEKILKKALTNIVKICSTEHLSILISRSLPGIPLEHIKIPPPGLPRRPDSKYFQIDRTHTLWNFVERDHNIQIFWEPLPEDLQAEIVVLRRD